MAFRNFVIRRIITLKIFHVTANIMLSLDYQLKKQFFLFLVNFENCIRCVFARLCRSGLRSRRYRKATSALIGARLSANCQGPGLIIFPRVRRLIRLARSDRKYQCFHVPTFFAYLHRRRCRRRRRQLHPFAE